MILVYVSYLFYLAALGAGIVVAMDAFKKKGALWGVLSFCTPYGWYYAVKELEHPKKMLIAGVLIGGSVGGMVLGNIGARMAVADAMEAAGVPAEE